MVQADIAYMKKHNQPPWRIKQAENLLEKYMNGTIDPDECPLFHEMLGGKEWYARGDERPALEVVCAGSMVNGANPIHRNLTDDFFSREQEWYPCRVIPGQSTMFFKISEEE